MNYCKFCTDPINSGSVCRKCANAANQTVPAHRLLPGTVLNNRYLIGKTLGEGGFGITYVGRDLKLNLKVAVKEYYPNGLVNRNHVTSSIVNCSVSADKKEFFFKGRDKFLLEARTLALFSKEKSVVEVRDFFEANNTAYIIMEYLEGQDLREYLKVNGVLPYDKAIQTLMPVMRALAKIHKQSLIHRDISPDNIRLTPEGVKLIDFGAAREMTTQFNQSISVMLKPGYAPEEQYRSKGVQGPWTDVYAVCATLYKCITGTTPDDATQRVYADELKMPSQLGFKIPPSVEKVIIKGMSVLQQNRYQNMDELMNALTNALTSTNSKLSDPAQNSNLNDTPLIPERKVSASSGTVKVSGGTIPNTNISGRSGKTEKTNLSSYNGKSNVSNSGVVVQKRIPSAASIQNGNIVKSQHIKQTTVQPISNHSNYTPPPSPPDKDKKNYTPYVIIGAIAIIAAIIGVILVFTLNSGNGAGNAETTTPTTSVSKPSEAERLADAEQLAEDILNVESTFDVKSLADYEIIGWEPIETAFDNYFIEETYADSVDAAYEQASVWLEVDIANAQDFIDYVYADPEISSSYEDVFGSNFKIECSNMESSFITKEDASGYIQLTKSKIDRYGDAGFDSSDVDWASVEEYALVEFDAEYSGSIDSQEVKYTMLFGYINNEWKLIYAEDNFDGVECLFTMTMVGGFFEE